MFSAETEPSWAKAGAVVLTNAVRHTVKPLIHSRPKLMRPFWGRLFAELQPESSIVMIHLPVQCSRSLHGFDGLRFVTFPAGGINPESGEVGRLSQRKTFLRKLH
jgi:hypothetical protein